MSLWESLNILMLSSIAAFSLSLPNGCQKVRLVTFPAGASFTGASVALAALAGATEAPSEAVLAADPQPASMVEMTNMIATALVINFDFFLAMVNSPCRLFVKHHSLQG